MDYCIQGSFCFEMAKGLPAAFVTLVIGGIAASIAWRQNETTKAKLKLDLFDKRYEIFEKTWAFLSGADKMSQNPELLHPFTNLIPQAGFLFGRDIEKYLRNASKKQTELRSIYAKSRRNNDLILPEDVEPQKELQQWFYEEASIGAKRVFSPYLNFEKWK